METSVQRLKIRRYFISMASVLILEFIISIVVGLYIISFSQKHAHQLDKHALGPTALALRITVLLREETIHFNQLYIKTIQSSNSDQLIEKMVHHVNLLDNYFTLFEKSSRNQSFSSTLQGTLPHWRKISDIYKVGHKTKTFSTDDITTILGHLRILSSDLDTINLVIKDDVKEMVRESNQFLNNAEDFLFITLIIGLVIGITLSLTILTSLMAVFEEMHLNKNMLIAQSKLASVGKMASGIAHEINNPLTIITGTIQVLGKTIERGNLTDEKLKTSFTKITSMSKRIASIIKALRIVGREGNEKEFKNVKIGEVFEDVLALSEEKLKKKNINLVIDLELPIYKVEIYAHRVKLSQVFINILGNAYDALLESEETVDGRERNLTIDVKKTNKMVEFRFINNGPKIPQDVKEKIFDPFYTTKDVGKGTGLGLSLSHSIILEHKGLFTLDERFFRTCFLIAIPVSTP